MAAVDREDSLDVPQQLYKLKNEIFDPLTICHLGYSPAADPLLGWGTTVANPEKQQTFGPNIYDLLRKEFALEDGFMGEFSRGKMNQVIDSPREHQLIKEWPKNTGRKFCSGKAPGLWQMRDRCASLQALNCSVKKSVG